jgi:hypothetical protein
MASWKLLLGAVIIGLIISWISWLAHCRYIETTSKELRTETPHPYQIISLISLGTILASIVFYIFR